MFYYNATSSGELIENSVKRATGSYFFSERCCDAIRTVCVPNQNNPTNPIWYRFHIHSIHKDFPLKGSFIFDRSDGKRFYLRLSGKKWTLKIKDHYNDSSGK